MQCFPHAGGAIEQTRAHNVILPPTVAEPAPCMTARY